MLKNLSRDYEYIVPVKFAVETTKDDKFYYIKYDVGLNLYIHAKIIDGPEPCCVYVSEAHTLAS